jgi:hypothetical protein
VTTRMLYVAFPELSDLDKKKRSPAEWHLLLDKVVDRVTESYNSPEESQSQSVRKLKLYAAFTVGFPRAKQYLIANGRKAAEVEAMPIAQVVLLYLTQHYDELCDQMRRTAMLPYPEAIKEIKNLEEQLDKLRESKSDLLIAKYVPKLASTRTFAVELDQKIAALSIFEAIRIYGAAHDGRLPEKLSDIMEVPIPNDPMRGQPFLYHREGVKAVLESPAISFRGAMRYEIEMKRKEGKPAS